MRKGALVGGLGMTLVGGYFFTISMIMIINFTLDFDWTIWTIYLTLGIVLVSVGPGLLVWAFVSGYQKDFQQIQWQVIRLPTECPECHHSIEIHSLEWIGPNEARCPFCSNELDIRKSPF